MDETKTKAKRGSPVPDERDHVTSGEAAKILNTSRDSDPVPRSRGEDSDPGENRRRGLRLFRRSDLERYKATRAQQAS